MALLSAANSWMGVIDRGSLVGALMVDLSNAFDTVSHRLIIEELTEIGRATCATNWFSSYLTDRAQRKVSKNEITPWKPVSRGVPQGSCLSLLLFNIFVRKLPASSAFDVFQFADDTTLSETNTSIEVIGE